MLGNNKYSKISNKNPHLRIPMQNRRFKKLSCLTANQWPQGYFDNVITLPLF